MSYLCTRIHSCGQKIEVHENWNGQSYYFSFASYQSQVPIESCPSCGDTLLPADMGHTLLTEDAYQSLISVAAKLVSKNVRLNMQPENEMEKVAVTPESALLARFAEIVEERRVPLLSANVQIDRALLHLLRSCEDKFVYEGDKEAFHKQFRQQDVTGNADIDMAIWWLLGGSERFWSAFDEAKGGNDG